MPLSAEDRLVRARTALERHGVAAPDLLAPEITASWSRCLSAGLDPHRPPKLEAIDDFALNTARQQVELTRRLALAEMEALYQQIAGSNFLIAFAAPNGVLLDTIADASFRAAARTASIRPGTLWTETRCGTNALGTSLELLVIAATVIGGTALAGGSGSIVGSVLGALIMQCIDSGMLLLDVSIGTRYVVIGQVLIAAVVFDVAYRKWTGDVL